MNDRLPARLEATALIRQVESQGGFATVIKRGDPDSGALVLLIVERGTPVALVEQRMDDKFDYRWGEAARGGALVGDKFLKLIAERTRFDPDFWLIELDIPDAERFIAETIASG